MLGALESNKYLYTIEQNDHKLKLLEPIKTSNPNVVTFDIVNLESSQNTIYYASIEAGNCKDQPIKKQLVIYELTLATNSLKTSSHNIPESAHLLLKVPSQHGSVFILCEDFLVYRSFDGKESKVDYPKRAGMKGTLIVSASQLIRELNQVEYLLQNEYGDLLKLMIHQGQISLEYFDTIPVSVSLCITASGTIFAPCERGDHNYYIFKSYTIQQEEMFKPKYLKNLQLLQTFPNFSCITDLQVRDSNDSQEQSLKMKEIYMLCSAGERSSLRILKYGLLVDELVSQKFKFSPLGIWTIKKKNDDTFHKYVILSKQQQTVVLQFDETLREVFDTGIELDVQTIHVSLLEDNSILQVKPQGLHLIRKDNPWQQNFEGKIVKVSANSNQVAIGFTGGCILYLEVKEQELQQIGKPFEKNHEISALEVGPLIEQKLSRFLAVGLSDRSIQILSLAPESRFQILQNVSYLESVADTFCMMEMPILEGKVKTNKLILFVGQNDGFLMQIMINKETGNFVDTRAKKIGNSSVKCCKFSTNGAPALLALSNRPWVCYIQLGRLEIQPICSDQFIFAMQVDLENAEECILGMTSSLKNKEMEYNFKVISIEQYGEVFNQRSIQLSHSPRKMIFLENGDVALIESDRVADQIEEQMEADVFNMEEEQMEGTSRLIWASCLTLIYSVEDQQSKKSIDLPNNDHACSLGYYKQQETNAEFILVGTVKNLQNLPERRFSKAYIHTFQYEKGDAQLLSITNIDELPYCIKQWKNRIIAAIGKTLVLFEFGKDSLKKICELIMGKTFINNIHLSEDKIFITESAGVQHVINYDEKQKTFLEIARDFMPRFATASAILDSYTIVGADKFENVYVNNMPLDIDQRLTDQQSEVKFRMDQGYFNEIPAQMKQLCNYQLGEVVTSLRKTQIESIGNDVIAYSTTMGSIGAFYPIESSDDLDFYIRLEMLMRTYFSSISNQDHFKYRSFSGACKGVIDGDLCEQFSSLTEEQQARIALEFQGEASQIIRKLYEIKNKIL